jgi:hypothetical protein
MVTHYCRRRFHHWHTALSRVLLQLMISGAALIVAVVMLAVVVLVFMRGCKQQEQRMVRLSELHFDAVMLICCTKHTGCKQECASTEQCCTYVPDSAESRVIAAAVHADQLCIYECQYKLMSIHRVVHTTLAAHVTCN